MSELALRLIAENKAAHARGEDATSLDLGNCGLTELPEELFDCVWLEKLIISNEYWEYQKKEWVESANSGAPNRVDVLPGGISCLVKLAFLSFGGNYGKSWNLSDIGALAMLTGLRTLCLSGNRIRNLEPLSSLKDLEILDLSFCQLRNLQQLPYFPGLRSLLLSENQISDLGPIPSLKTLETLDLSRNRIRNLIPISSFEHVRTLDLSNNMIHNISPLASLKSLQKLNLTFNRIKKLPLPFLEGIPLEIDFHDFYNANRILLGGNPIESPSLDVLNQGRAFALEYLRNIDKQPLNECKIIIVGRGGVGKTSLQKRLTNQDFNPQEPETHGIRKESWAKGVKASDGKAITVNFWDFGGQDIQQTLHQFFYSRNTLYILVLNKRYDEDPEDFLELIRAYGHNSPVLIAYNTMIRLDEEGNAAYDLSPELDSSLRSKYPNIRRTFGLCCGQEQDVGVNALRKYLQDYIPTLDHVREPYPRSWLTIKQELLGKVQSNYIHYEEYEKLCRTHQVEQQQIQKGLAEMLDSVGTITFFDRQFLGNYYILNPDWLTTGTYQIIDSKQTTAKRGKISMEDMRIIFSQPLLFTYKPDEYEFLLQLMEEFDLCHRFSRTEWLIPSSLEGQSKTNLVDYRKGQYRQYNLQYEVSLPSSIIHRFIARNIRYAYEEDYWRNGIVVKHPDSRTILFVEADKRERQIRLFVKGERIRDGWEYFRKDLKEFSGEFSYEEQVMLPSGDAVSYQYLMEAWEAGEDSVFISKKTGKINVREAIGLFEKQDEDTGLMHRKRPVKNAGASSDQLASIQRMIDQNNVYEAFEKMDELNLESALLSQLRDEFIGGQQGVNYIQRLKMCVNQLSKTL